MNINLKWALHELIGNGNFNPEKRYLDKIIKKSFQGRSYIIFKKIKNKLKSTYFDEVFKGLILFHFLCHNGNGIIFSEFKEIVIPKHDIKNVFSIDPNSYQFWCEHYSILLNHLLNFHHKYPCFDGCFHFPRKNSFLVQLKEKDLIINLWNDCYILFNQCNQYVIDIIRMIKFNDQLCFSVGIVVSDMIGIYLILTELHNFITSEYTQELSRIEVEENGCKKCLYQIKSKLSNQRMGKYLPNQSISELHLHETKNSEDDLLCNKTTLQISSIQRKMIVLKSINFFVNTPFLIFFFFECQCVKLCLVLFGIIKKELTLNLGLKRWYKKQGKIS
ncbi:hypothetical protein EDI_029580 [Entamoeba dispar SAW760]|uniref:ENTH domain-containing protein n=1 Tax=Entamoeba dispar (strain ATCC PRA-260 / SAW760) TaxID=370354 RepID=B0EV46_ENTDS|nr:uncharacterized protein EDI_029580 [Entamoeba dispar SAW760]EDR21599.1 hypothetical protein EDI_029580 [Entamoeba dispar SAW760]|eukprot:EDR21599.1 hypothetical protein EDI_029580 [Entamoeba dispar SAW760]